MRIQITHGDLDGVYCRVLGQLLKIKGLYDFANCYHYNYTDEEEMLSMVMSRPEIKEIVFTDFSPTVELYKYCESKRIRVQIYDHHQSAYTTFSNEDGTPAIPNFNFDNERSGTKIFYEDFYVPLAGRTFFLDYVVSLVDCYDMWRDTSMLWEEANNLQRAFIGMTDYKMDDIYFKFISLQIQKSRSMSNEFKFLPRERSAIERMVAKEQEALQFGRDNVKFREDNSGIPYMYLELRSKISFVASNLLSEYREYKYIVIRNMYTGGVEFSLRCKDGFDVRQIAEKNAGGGHLLAAGVCLDNEKAEAMANGEIHLN